MRIAGALLVGSLLLGCAQGGEGPTSNETAGGAPAAAGGDTGSGWDLQSSDEGLALVLGPGADAAIRLFCSAGGGRLLVNVPSFRPVGSEERLSFGSGGEVVALVADTRGDPERGGVSGTGTVPDNLAALLSGPVSATYGAQTSGPHQALPEQLASAFVAGCSGEPLPQPPPDEPRNVSACLIQDDRRIGENRMKAIGTEPFWAAEIHGRCVTYSTPENQAGTRVWTRFSGSADRGQWSGYLDGQRFVLRTRPEPGCSDGMSDKSYPVAATLTVRGEERSGCADHL